MESRQILFNSPVKRDQQSQQKFKSRHFMVLNNLKKKEENWDNRFHLEKIPDYNPMQEQYNVIPQKIQFAPGKIRRMGASGQENQQQQLGVAHAQEQQQNSQNQYVKQRESKLELNDRSYISNKSKLRQKSISKRLYGNKTDAYMEEQAVIYFEEIKNLWKQYNIPAQHREIFLQVIRSSQKQKALDILKAEINDMKNEAALVQNCENIIKSREQCLEQIKEGIKQLEQKNQDEEILNQISEYLTTLRLKTISVIECVVSWRDYFNSYLPQKHSAYIPYIHEEINYLMKVKNDSDFLNQTILVQNFNFSPKPDPFLKAITMNRDPQSHIIQHFISKTLTKRIKACEIVLLEETVQQSDPLSNRYKKKIHQIDLVPQVQLRPVHHVPRPSVKGQKKTLGGGFQQKNPNGSSYAYQKQHGSDHRIGSSENIFQVHNSGIKNNGNQRGAQNDRMKGQQSRISNKNQQQQQSKTPVSNHKEDVQNSSQKKKSSRRIIECDQQESPEKQKQRQENPEQQQEDQEKAVNNQQQQQDEQQKKEEEQQQQQKLLEEQKAKEEQIKKQEEELKKQQQEKEEQEQEKIEVIQFEIGTYENSVQQLENDFGEYIKDVTQDQVQSFISDFSILVQKALQFQEISILVLKKDGVLSGFCIIGVDKSCFTNRRMYIQHISSKNREEFSQIVKQVSEYIWKYDPATEIRVDLYHFENENNKAAMDKEIQKCFKEIGYKWKMVQNDPIQQKRFTILSCKRPENIDCLNKLNQPEPIVLGNKVDIQYPYKEIPEEGDKDFLIQCNIINGVNLLWTEDEGKNQDQIREDFAGNPQLSQLNEQIDILKKNEYRLKDFKGQITEKEGNKVYESEMQAVYRWPEFNFVNHEQYRAIQFPQREEYIECFSEQIQGSLYLIPKEDEGINYFFFQINDINEFKKQQLGESLKNIFSGINEQNQVNGDIVLPCFDCKGYSEGSQKTNNSNFNIKQGFDISTNYNMCIKNFDLIKRNEGARQTFIKPPFVFGIIQTEIEELLEIAYFANIVYEKDCIKN